MLPTGSQLPREKVVKGDKILASAAVALPEFDRVAFEQAVDGLPGCYSTTLSPIRQTAPHNALVQLGRSSSSFYYVALSIISILERPNLCVDLNPEW
jgi:hypothetical protein